jgi:hypothetical protein
MKSLKTQIVAPLLIALALTTSACATQVAPAVSAIPVAAATEPPQLKIVATDHHYMMPSQIKAGYINMVMENAGKEPHHAQFLRLNDNVTMEQFQIALQEGVAAVMTVATLTGGPSVIDPGMSQSVTLNLAPGQYMLLCVIAGADGVPHLAKGMVAPLTVIPVEKEADQAVANAAPKADGQVRLLDFSFALPQTIKAGQQTWEIKNDGKQPHEMTLIKLAAGKTMADVAAFMAHPAGAPPFADVGGMQGIMPGDTAWLDLNLEPGNYVALCHIPDMASGEEHMHLGMIMPFSVK